MKFTNSLIFAEKVGINPQPRFLPLHVKIEREGDAKVSIVDLQHVRNVDLDLDVVGFVLHRNVHAGVVAR